MSRERAEMLNVARQILAFAGGENERRNAFPDFYENHNKLFNIICSGRCDLTHLEMMFNMMNSVETGEITADDASIAVATRLNATYVESVIPVPTPEQAVRQGEETKITVIEK